MEEEATHAKICRWLDGPQWGLAEYVRVTEGLRRSSFALALSLGAGPTHCLAPCWQPGARGLAYRSGWTCGCPEAKSSKRLSCLLVARLVSLWQSTVHLRLLVPLVKGSGHVFSLLYLLFLSHEELFVPPMGAGEAA